MLSLSLQENTDVVHRGRGVETADDGTLVMGAGIASGCHHHGQRRLVVPAQVEFSQLAVAGRHQRGDDVRHQPRHQHLTFRIAEPCVVFKQFRAVRGEHQPGIEYPLVWSALGFHGFDRGRDDRVHHRFGDCFGNGRRWRQRAHAPGVWSRVAVADAFVVLGCRQRQDMFTVDQREEACLFAFQELLDHDFGSGCAVDAPRQHGVHRCVCLFRCFAYDDALAARRPVGLDDDRRAASRNKRFGCRRIGKPPV